MAHYMWQVAYTPEAWAAQVASPQDRRDAVGPVVERYGGRRVLAQGPRPRWAARWWEFRQRSRLRLAAVVGLW